MPDQVAIPEVSPGIARSRVLEALDLLGLPRSCRELTIHHEEGVTLSMWGRTEEGRLVTAGGGNPVVVTVHIPFGPEG